MPTRHHSLFLLLFLAPAWLLAQPSALEVKLFNLPDVIFKKIDTPEGFEAAYELQIRQLIDHEDASKGFFYQRAYLSHRSFGPPISDWRERGAISHRAKRFATVSILAAFAIAFALGIQTWVLAIQVLTLAMVAAFIWTRPNT